MPSFNKILNKLRHKIKNKLNLNTTSLAQFPLNPVLPLPLAVSESQLSNFLETVMVGCETTPELLNYCKQDLRRFIYTYGLAHDLQGRCLELGANPYFTTFLLKQFTSLELTLANYFGNGQEDKIFQQVSYRDFQSHEEKVINLESNHFNLEEEEFPFESDSFDVVLFCEIIEHLLMDPVKVILEIKRVLKQGGYLILTTPNVARLENVAKMVSGENIYDPYSGYGPYGRHNREYNKHELYKLLDYLGFEVESMFTADVHPNHYANLLEESVLQLLNRRSPDLGQYIFVKAINMKPAKDKKPSFLYRSYPRSDLEEVLSY